MRGLMVYAFMHSFMRAGTPCLSADRLKLRLCAAELRPEMSAQTPVKSLACNFAALRVESPPLQNLLSLFRLFKVCESLLLHRTAYDLSKSFVNQFRSSKSSA